MGAGELGDWDREERELGGEWEQGNCWEISVSESGTVKLLNANGELYKPVITKLYEKCGMNNRGNGTVQLGNYTNCL